MDTCTDDPLLANCVDYSDEYTLFSDHFSAIALSPAASDALGVQRLLFKGLNQGSILPTLEPCLRPFLRAPDGTWEHVAALSCTSRPDGWVQHGATTGYCVRQEVSFLDAGHVRVVWEVEADGAQRGAPDFGVLGAVAPGQGRLLHARRAGPGASFVLRKSYRNVFLQKDAVFTARFDLRFAAAEPSGGGFRADEALPALAPAEDGWSQELVESDRAAWWITTTPQPAPGGWRIELVMSVAVAGDEAGAVSAAPLTTMVAHFDYDGLPDPQPATLYWKRKLRQALATIIGAGVRHPGYGAFSADLGLLASIPNWSSTVWSWDHFIYATAIGAFRPEWMESAVRCLLQHTSGGRMGPGILTAFPAYGPDDHLKDCYAPIATWAVLKAWKAYGRRPDLASIYTLLAEFHEAWFRHCDRDGDGIPEWRNAGNPADDSPRFDAYAPGKGSACFGLPPFPSADLCAYLLLDARCLAHIASELGDAAGVARWQERAGRLRRQLLERHWDAEGLFFHDLDPQGRMVRVKTFFGLLPLWADPDLLPPSTAQAAIRRHLLNPEEFWGEIPFPSVAYDEPTYKATGYWRGRTWGHVYFWNAELLHLHGFHAEADEACRRYLRVTAAHKEPMENYPTDPGLLHQRTVRSYNWCGAGTVFFLLGWHRQPVQRCLV
jgi:hypothetical protein